MNKLMVMAAMALALAVGLLTAPAADAGAVQSLRGDLPLEGGDNQAPEHKRWQADRPPMPRNYLQQPPLIPHTAEEYTIDQRQNKCLTCHSWTNYRQYKATKISMTHFRDRGGTETADVSPQRYFCNTCHVPQVDAQPLVENDFKPVEALTSR